MTADEFRALLNDVRADADRRLREQYQRSLPFGDAMFDRWERATALGFAEGASIYDSALVYGDVTVGANTWVGPNTLLDGSGGGLRIGDYCSISAGVQIYTHDTVMWALSGGREKRRTGAVSIGGNTYIGSQSIIALSVSIGRQCVVAANSFVNESVADRTIVGGTPARPIGRVEVAGDNITLRYDSAAEGDGVEAGN